MDNQELLNQIGIMFRQQQEVMVEYFDQKFDQKLTQLEAKMEDKTQKQIDALFDGFKMMQESHQEHEQRISKIETHDEETDIRLLSLENKGA